MSPSEADKQKLRSKCKSSPVMKIILECFANKRMIGENQLILDDFRISVDDVEKHLEDNQFLGRSDIIEGFKILEELGWGSFKSGRRGHQSRFEANIYRGTNISSIGKLATDTLATDADDDANEESGMKARGNSLSNNGRSSINEKEVPSLLTHKYYLRENCSVNIELPIDLTATEAERLACHIKTLPFRE
jgi:hypothetical protein